MFYSKVWNINTNFAFPFKRVKLYPCIESKFMYDEKFFFRISPTDSVWFNLLPSCFPDLLLDGDSSAAFHQLIGILAFIWYEYFSVPIDSNYQIILYLFMRYSLITHSIAIYCINYLLNSIVNGVKVCYLFTCWHN